MSVKAAVIGDAQTVLGFRALGLTTRFASNAQQAEAALDELAAQQHVIIYVTEQLLAQMPDAGARYRDNPDVAVIAIPSNKGTLGIGERELHSAVERAVGADLLKDR